MMHHGRVAREIRDVGLYDRILQEIRTVAGKQEVDVPEIGEIIRRRPDLLDEYMQTNVACNLSNIHLGDLPAHAFEGECRRKAETVNANLALLRRIEKYTLDFEQSPSLVMIFSAEFFVLFSVQYFIVLLNLKAWQWEIYGVFALSVLAAWLYARSERHKFAENARRFAQTYEATEALLALLEADGCLNRADHMIDACDDHV